jgi:hypothetical protein
MTVDQYERLVQTGVLGGEKRLVYARGGVPVYWIVNLVDGQLEIHTGATATGYRDRRVSASNEQVPVTIGGRECGHIAVSLLLPRSGPDRATAHGNST